MSNESFAAHLGVAVRTVAAWHQKPELRPRPEMQQLLDSALERASAADQARFADSLTGGTDVDSVERLAVDPVIEDALDWLDRHAGRPPGRTYRDVAALVARTDVDDLRAVGARRASVDRARIVDALTAYYGQPGGGPGLYAARLDAGPRLATSILTGPDWLDLGVPLDATTDRLWPVATNVEDGPSLDENAADRAAHRLAETLTLGTRMVNMPLYRLVSVDLSEGTIAGTLVLTQFTRYALTMDLLEAELVDSLTTGAGVPLRDAYLPDLASVLDLPGRLCAGGTLALCAIARPASRFRGPADYVLLIQERSGSVVNAARRLAVIPKGFHQPMTDVRADAQLSATLRREMEEELFGRTDIDNTVSTDRRADPMHPSRLSEPMRWLDAHPDSFRMECTGFGINLVSGNYEFPALVVIDDEEFWSRYGGTIEANWETAGLRQGVVRKARTRQ
jgi:hypothetical protein